MSLFFLQRLLKVDNPDLVVEISSPLLCCEIGQSMNTYISAFLYI